MPAKGTRVRDKAKTKAALIEVAEELFARHGYEGASLELIARQVGVDRALIPYYFKNKSGLYQAIIAKNAGDVRDKLEEAMPEGVSAPEAMRIYIRSLVEIISERSNFAALIIREHVSTAFMGDQASAAELLGFYRITLQILEMGWRERVFRKVDPHLFHLNLVGSTIYFTTTERFRQNADLQEKSLNLRPELTAYIDHMTSILMDGLLTAP
ncbi:MAG: TetR/AcrR family transcriptional regulator [Alphaproteobacteria bacterium]|nr:MAG: TetR/AcrR family transcriptional regulator [Alphaproteobacteria bacterium]